MRIERIDEKTVKCFLSNDELEAYEITYKDFVLRSEKAKEIVEQIIEQAEEKVGYQPPKYAFDLQIMMLPDKGMILTFSESDPRSIQGANDRILDCLREMKHLLEEKGNEAPLVIEEPQNSKGRKQEISESSRLPEFAIFAFEKLRDVCDYASMIPKGLRVKSALYQMDGSYYLCLRKGTASYEKYSRACVQAIEFGTLYSADIKKLALFEEHGQCLAEDYALKKVRFES